MLIKAKFNYERQYNGFNVTPLAIQTGLLKQGFSSGFSGKGRATLFGRNCRKTQENQQISSKLQRTA